MSTKHFIADPEQAVLDSLEALVWMSPSLAVYGDSIVNSAHDPQQLVALVSGGGAGHEPAHAHYVGDGMLTAAVSGSIFASPSVLQIVNTIRHIQNGGSKGVLLIVKNYTGDQLHFNLAAAKVRALGINVNVVTVGDDVSVGRKRSGRVGRRGLAGTVFAHKIAGALAGRPTSSLTDVSFCAQEVAASLATVASSLAHVHVPGRRADDMVVLKDDEMELGMGIHNEPGCRSVRPIPPLRELVGQMLDQLLDLKDEDRAYVDFWESGRVVLMVNNLGGLSVLELGAISKEVIAQLRARGLTLVRIYTGTFMTSLDQPGFSITLLKALEKFVGYLDAPTTAVGWRVSPDASKLNDGESSSSRIYGSSKLPPPKEPTSTLKRKEDLISQLPPADVVVVNGDLFKAVVIAGCSKVIGEEPNITHFDTIAGDGDCGVTLKRGAEGVVEFLQSGSFTPDAIATFAHLSNIVEETMGGTSGALYSIFLQGFVDYFRSLTVHTEEHVLQVEDFVNALKHSLDTLQKATAARVGDRTMMDALSPFIETLADSSLESAVEAARSGAKKTQEMTASLGRSVYVAQNSYGKVPDPGATGVVAFVEGALNGLQGHD